MRETVQEEVWDAGVGEECFKKKWLTKRRWANRLSFPRRMTAQKRVDEIVRFSPFGHAAREGQFAVRLSYPSCESFSLCNFTESALSSQDGPQPSQRL